MKIIHFIGTSKPWHVKFDANGQPQPQLYEEHTAQFLKQWWHIFHTWVKPALSQVQAESSVGLNKDVSAALSVATESASRSEESAPTGASSSQDRSRWEQGAPDYKGADSFDNIIKKLDSTMSTTDNSKYLRSTAIFKYQSSKSIKFLYLKKPGGLGKMRNKK